VLKASLGAGAALFLFGLMGCASISTFQSGKTLPDRSSDLGVGMSAGKIPTHTHILGFDADLPSVSMEGWFRHGLSDRLEVGGKIALPGFYAAQVRRGIFNESRGDSFSLAAGTGVGYVSPMKNRLSFAGFGAKDTTWLTDVPATFFISKDVGPALTLYGSPRAVWRHTDNRRSLSVGPGTHEKFNDTLVGAGAGFILHLGRVRLMLEYNRLIDTMDPSRRQSSAGFGLGVQLGPSTKPNPSHPKIPQK
jgi:hypothetical protein